MLVGPRATAHRAQALRRHCLAELLARQQVILIKPFQVSKYTGTRFLYLNMGNFSILEFIYNYYYL
jgi:hypothetical protein